MAWPTVYTSIMNISTSMSYLCVYIHMYLHMHTWILYISTSMSYLYVYIHTYIPMYICILVHQYEPLLSRKKKTRHGLRSHMNRKREKAFQNLEMAVSPIVFSALPLIQYLIYYRSDDGVSESGDGGFPDSH